MRDKIARCSNFPQNLKFLRKFLKKNSDNPLPQASRRELREIAQGILAPSGMDSFKRQFVKHATKVELAEAVQTYLRRFLAELPALPQRGTSSLLRALRKPMEKVDTTAVVSVPEGFLEKVLARAAARR